MATSKLSAVGYWVTTGLIALGNLVGGAFDVANPPQVVAEMAHLGYPAYLAPLLGSWKILGALALLAPRFPRLKEWAYAGIFFDLTGAAVSHASSGDPTSNVVTPLIGVLVLAASWALRPESRRLAPAFTNSRRPASITGAAPVPA